MSEEEKIPNVARVYDHHMAKRRGPKPMLYQERGLNIYNRIYGSNTNLGRRIKSVKEAISKLDTLDEKLKKAMSVANTIRLLKYDTTIPPLFGTTDRSLDSLFNHAKSVSYYRIKGGKWRKIVIDNYAYLVKYNFMRHPSCAGVFDTMEEVINDITKVQEDVEKDESTIVVAMYVSSKNVNYFCNGERTNVLVYPSWKEHQGGKE